MHCQVSKGGGGGGGRSNILKHEQQQQGEVRRFIFRITFDFVLIHQPSNSESKYQLISNVDQGIATQSTITLSRIQRNQENQHGVVANSINWFGA